MKNIACFLCLFIGFCFIQGNAQQLFFDDFESYTGNRIGPQSERWTTWSGNEGGQEDPFIVGDPTFSGTRSLEIKGDMFFPNGGPVDCILKLGNQTSGRYELSFQLFFEDADGMYYNFQHFETPGQEWAFEVSCHSGGATNGQVSCDLLVGGVTEPFTLMRGEWSKMTHIIDLDNNEATLIADDDLVHTWPFNWDVNGTSGTNQLGGINFFPRNGFDRYVIDDVEFTTLTSSEEAGIAEAKNQLLPNVGKDYFRLVLHSALLDQNIQATIYDTQGRQFKRVQIAQMTDQQLDFNDLPSGSYVLFLTSDQGQFIDRLPFVKI